MRTLNEKITNESFFNEVKLKGTGDAIDVRTQNKAKTAKTRNSNNKTGTTVGSNTATGTNFAPDIVVVANTATSGRFNLDDVLIDMLPIGGEGQNSIVSAGDITLTISEPAGVSFLNYLKSLFDDKLKTGQLGCVFGLIPYFVRL
jgi:hypothetical protein